MIPRSIRAKITLSVATLVSVSALVTTIAVISALMRHAREEIDRDLQAGAAAAGRFQLMREGLLAGQAQSLAAAPHLQATLAIPELDAATAQHTARALATSSGADIIALLDADGDGIATAVPGEPDDTLEFSFGGRLDQELHLLQHGGETYLGFSAPVVTGDALLGWLLVGQVIGPSFVGDLELATGHRVLVHAEDRLLGRKGDTGLDPDQIRQLRHRAEAAEHEVVALETSRGRVRALVRQLGSSGLWTVEIESLDEALATARQTATIIGGLALLTLLGVFLVARLISRRLAEPISRLELAARRIERGDLDAPVPVEGGDEVESLARSIRSMVARLRELLSEVGRQARSAQAASLAKSRFLATMSHELRTPLNAILGMSNGLLDGVREPDAREQCQVLDGAARELLFKINDILDYTSLHEGELSLRTAGFDPRVVLDEIVAASRHAARANGLRLVVEVAPEIPTRLIGDAARLRQALGHLVENAIKYTPAGHVHLTMREHEGAGARRRFRVTVEDTGPGIRPEDRDRIFEHFAQLDASDRRAHGGTGLGLSLAQAILRAMEGGLELDSTPGRGSAFHADFVLYEDASAREKRRAIRGVVRLEVPDPVLRRALACDCARLGYRTEASEGETVLGQLVARETGLEAIASHGAREVLALPPLASELERLLGTWVRSGQSEANDEGRELEGVRVLAVDDNATNLRVLELHLRRFGCSVARATNGLEALERVRNRTFDVVLMDCQMPVMDGFEATRRLREELSSAELPVIAVSAGVSCGDQERCFAAGMDAFLPKPVDREKLREEILRLRPVPA